MHRYLFPALVALALVAPTAASAQNGLRFSVAAGTLVDPYPTGQHATTSATLPIGIRALDLRLDLLATTTLEHEDNASSASLNLVYGPDSRRFAPYLVAGAGVATSGYRALNVGLGWNLPATLQLGRTGPGIPLFMELRAHHVRGTNVMLGIGARL